MAYTGIKENDKMWVSFAIRDIQKGYKTLWVKRLKKEYPEMFNYAVKQNNFVNEALRIK